MRNRTRGCEGGREEKAFHLYHCGMGAYASVAMLLLAGFAAINPAAMSWIYVAAVLAFELWLLRRIAQVDRAPVPAGEAPYLFSEEEAGLVSRYRFYFTYPAVAREASSVLAAVGDRKSTRLNSSH